MDIAVKAIGIAIILIGVVYFLKPEVMKRLMEFFKQGKRIYLAGLIRFILAIMFLLSASECRAPKVIAGFGILFIAGGLLIFTLGSEKIRTILEWYQNKSDTFLRVLALVALAFGALIIYFA